MAAGGAAAEDLRPYQACAERLMKAINAPDYGAIEREFNDQMRAALPIRKTEEFFAGLSAQLGKLRELGAGRWEAESLAVFAATFERGLLDMKLSLDQAGRIAGLLFVPHEEAAAVEAGANAAELALPMRGSWLVFWGGETREQNQHHGVRNQNYAFDMLGVGSDGKTRRGQARGNEDYYAWGREVLAPAAGVVTEVIEGVRDNLPGSMNPYSAVGNAVLIEHAPGVVSVMAHLQQGTTRVKAGERVRQGQVVGLCGNSGNSSEPHLHFHVQDRPVLQDGAGVKVYFLNVAGRQGKYSPVKGDVVSAAE
jgi:murein DD-endopeptidase MepM/ murein hydrolase activator NlpD